MTHTAKRLGRARAWTFTINNPKEDKLFGDKLVEQYNVKYIIYSLEEGTTEHTRHWQGYIYFKNPRTMKGIKQITFFKKAHLEIAKGTVEQNKVYITKAPINGIVYELGIKPEQGKRSDLETLKDLIIEQDYNMDNLLIDYPQLIHRYGKYAQSLFALQLKRKARKGYTQFIDQETNKDIIVLWGKAGTGKTSYIYRNYKMDDIYCLNFGDGSKGSFWMDDYQGEPILLLDDFYGQIKYSLILKLLDIYPLRLQCKGGFVYANFKKIYITSNQDPQYWYSGIEDTKALFRRITEIKEVEDQVLPSTSVPLGCSELEKELNDLVFGEN